MKVIAEAYMRLTDRARRVIKYFQQIKYFVGWFLVLALIAVMAISLSKSIKYKKYNAGVFEVNVKEDDFNDIFEQEISKNKIQSYKAIEQNQYIELKK